MTTRQTKKITKQQEGDLLTTLQKRFNENMNRCKNLEWSPIEEKLKKKPEKLWSLYEMEKTGGEPNLITYDTTTKEYVFYDCSPESPKGRRSLCYDRDAQEKRKEHKPSNNAIDVAKNMGIMILTEEQYRKLQALGQFDTKTSSWIQTPLPIRKLGGALFMDRRYDHVFLYHNGAESYYTARGFRGSLKV